MASYPGSIVVFSPLIHVTGDTLQVSDYNVPTAEITAIETGLLNGFAHNLISLVDGASNLGASGNRFNNLFIAGTLQTSNATMGIIEKVGTGTGNYSTTGAAYTNVDGTNLTYTTTVPTGWKLRVVAMCSAQNSGVGNTLSIAIADGGTVKKETTLTEPVASDFESMFVQHLVAGDGASHTLTLQWKVSAGTGTMANSTATLTPVMHFMLTPSN